MAHYYSTESQCEGYMEKPGSATASSQRTQVLNLKSLNK